jgi:hypothetical protein
MSPSRFSHDLFLPKARQPMRTFDNEWIFKAFENHPTFFSKRMFGGLAAYLFGRQMLVLVEPTKTGRWKWHGVLICTEHAHQSVIIEEFPQLAPHDILKKWLYIDSRREDFDQTMERVAEAIARDDPRFGIHPHPTKENVALRNGRRTVDRPRKEYPPKKQLKSNRMR